MLGPGRLGRVVGRPLSARFRVVSGLWGRGQCQQQDGLLGGLCGLRLSSALAGAFGRDVGLRSVEGEAVLHSPWGLVCVRGFKSIGGRGPSKDPLRDRSFKLNEEMKTLGGRGGTTQLFEIVRREGGKGKAEELAFNHVNCSNWLNKLVKCDVKDLQGKAPMEVVQVLGRTLHLLRETPAVFGPRAVANVANAVSQLQYKWEGDKALHVVVLKELGKWVVSRKEGMGDFEAIQVAMLINGFAKVGHNPGKEVLRKVVAACLRLDPRSFAPQGLSNVANGFAKLGVHPGKALLDMLSKECVRRGLKDFAPQAIANIANAFAKLGEDPGEELRALISKECVRRQLKGFTPQHISNIANAFAKWDANPGKELLDLVSRECVRLRLEGFTPQGIAHVANALAAFKHSPGQELLGLVLERCQRTSWAGFNRQGLSNVLHAVAILRGVPDGEWMAGFHRRCEEVGWEGFTNQDLRMILWACVVVEVPIYKGLVEALSVRLKSFLRGGAKGLDYEEGALKTSTVVRQALFLCEASGEKGLQELSEAAEAVWEVVKGRDKPPIESRLQQGVFMTLKASYGTVASEVWVVEGLLSLDVVITLACGAKVGVEVDGPPHFFGNRPDVPTGEVMIKWRMLDKCVELGLLQGWVSVRHRGARELAKVGEAVRRVERGTR